MHLSALLAGLVILLSLEAVHSLSIQKKRNPQLVTVPLKRIPLRSDVHPRILLQMHINRSILRLAKMTGTEPPSARSLEQLLEKRILAVEGPSGLQKRRNRLGVPPSTNLEKRFNRLGHKHVESRPGFSFESENGQGSSSDSEIESAVTPTTPNSLGLDILGLDGTYLATIQIGTPPRNFSIIMDTGSGDFWVGGENCQLSQQQPGQNQKRDEEYKGRGQDRGPIRGTCEDGGPTGDGCLTEDEVPGGDGGGTGSPYEDGGGPYPDERFPYGNGGDPYPGGGSPYENGDDPYLSGEFPPQNGEGGPGGCSSTNSPNGCPPDGCPPDGNPPDGSPLNGGDPGGCSGENPPDGCPPPGSPLNGGGGRGGGAGGGAGGCSGADGCPPDGSPSYGGGGCGIGLGPQSSSSFQDTGVTFQDGYGSGQVSGDMVTDTIVIAGLTLANHSFGVANQEMGSFEDVDGLMGLSQSTLSSQQVPTPVEALAKAGLISEPIVSFHLARRSDQVNDGEVTFGGLDNSKFNSKTLVTLTNINPKGFWEAPLDGISVNGVDLGLTGRTTILDTGTTVMLVPDEDAATIHNQIPGASSAEGGYTIPCDSNATVTLTYSGQPFTIQAQDLAFQPSGGDSCESGIQAGNFGGGPNEWLAGDTFLKNVYFSTDAGKNTLSLAQLA